VIRHILEYKQDNKIVRTIRHGINYVLDLEENDKEDHKESHVFPITDIEEQSLNFIYQNVK
jgi:hypothetical protein